MITSNYSLLLSLVQTTPTPTISNIPKSIAQAESFFVSIINNSNYIELISIVVVAITTYFVTKYTMLKPNRQRIKQLQLDNVYLPLFRLLLEFPKSTTKEDALEYHGKIANILDKHYELVFPELHKLNNELKQQLLKDQDYNSTLRIIKHQVEIDYDLLKKSLGYPSSNFIEIFIRMTRKQRIIWFISWLNVILLFSPIIGWIPLTLLFSAQKAVEFASCCMIAYIFVLFFIIKINNWAQKLKD